MISIIVNFEDEKANIQSSFSSKTASHVYKLLEEFGFQTIFERSDAQEILGSGLRRNNPLLELQVKVSMTTERFCFINFENEIRKEKAHRYFNFY